MTPAARLSAAIEVLADIADRRRPAPDALKDWGLSHRFAGSKDRAVIASLVYDALRRRASSAWLMASEAPRAVLLGSLLIQRGLGPTEIASFCTGEGHAPAPLDPAESAALADIRRLEAAPDDVRCDCPAWILPSLADVFGPALVAEMQALAARAPVDIRVNTLKCTRDQAEWELRHLNPQRTPLSPDGLRFAVGDDGRGPSLQAEKPFFDGWFEIQDEGSQIVARLAGAAPGMEVVDLCAGGGGKTLALAALMENKGRIVATDADPRRLAPIYDRLSRAGIHNVETRPPKGKGHDPLADLDGTTDLVVVDAPCTGTGTWRRNPDAKWRLRPNALALRVSEQAAVLDRAARLVRPGGRILYITCSVLPEENDEAVASFLARHKGFGALAAADSFRGAPFDPLPWSTPAGGLQLSPLRSGTDGFYARVLVRR